MSDQATAVEMDAVEQIEALLDGPEGEPEEEQVEADAPEVEGSDVEEGEAEEVTTDTEEAQPQEEPLEVIQWNGEEKQVTKSELKELAQKGFDYTQKTQQLAEERRQVESAIRNAQQSIAIQNQQVELVAQVKALDSQLEQFKSVNWLQLAEQDPVEYLKLNQTYRDIKEAREVKVHEYQKATQQFVQMNQQYQHEYMQTEAKKLSQLPEFKGEKATETKAQIKTYLREIGFSDDEIGMVNDSRYVRVAMEAAKWRALQASKPQVQKRVAEAPKVVKPGTNKPQPSKSTQETYSNLRKTGKGEYAAKLIEQML